MGTKRNKLGRSVLATVCAAALAFGGVSAPAFADLGAGDAAWDDAAQGQGAVVYAYEDDAAGGVATGEAAGEAQGFQLLANSFDFASDEPRDALLAQSDDLPAAFDLRSVDTDGDGEGDRCYVTPVKLQNPFGVCWGFAAVAAAETSILGSLMADDANAYQTLDLSEKQLAYFSHAYLNRVGHPQDGEGSHFKDASLGSDVYAGGSTFLATSVFAQGIGPVNESRGDVFEYHGTNSQTVQRMMDGEYRDFSYSEEDDWSIDESNRFKQDYVLQESYILPSPATQDATGAYAYNEAGTAAIKEQLLNKRAVEVGFHADASTPNQEGQGAYLNYNTWAHYTYEMTSTNGPNHAVTIVGWDDDYAVENFNEGAWTDPQTGEVYNRVRPPAKGAWLVKNSWGSGERDFPNRGSGDWGIPVEVQGSDGTTTSVGSGYFWLSYYDQRLMTPEAFVFDEYKADTPYYLDEHDYLPASSVIATTAADETKMANVFTAEGNERLTAVSFETSAPATTVSYEVYLLRDGYTSPVDGTLKAKGAAVTYEYGGFYKASLADAEEGGVFDIQKGQSYSIVVTQTLDVNGETRYSVNTPFGLGDGSPMLTADDPYAVAVINEGESLVYANGTWKDYALSEVRQEIGVESSATSGLKAAFDNFPIKGFGSVLPDGVELRLTNAATNLYVNAGKNVKTMRAVLYSNDDSGTEAGAADVTWSLAEGDEDILSVEPGADGTATLTAKGMGTATLTVTVTGTAAGSELALSKVVSVVVGKIVPYLASPLTGRISPYTGEEICPPVIVASNARTALVEGKDYTLRYVDNVKCGAAYAEVIPTDEADDKIRAYFAITPLASEVTSLAAPSETSFAISVNDQQATGIGGYQVDYRESGDDVWRTKTFGASSAQLVVDGLAYNTAYEVRVRSYVDTTTDAQTAGLEATYYGDYSDVGTVTTLAHEWSAPSYTWSADSAHATATRTCAHCGMAQTETVAATEVQTKAAGPATAGAKTCTAKFTSSWATTQAKKVVIAPTGRISLSSATVKGVVAKAYTGAGVTQSPKVRLNGTLLKENADYLLVYKNNVKVGSAKVTVKGINDYKGAKTLSFKVTKAAQPLKVTASKKTVRFAKLKRGARTVKGALAVSGNVGALSYANASTAKAPKRFKVNAKTGAITLPRATKRGVYQVKVKVVAKASASYKQTAKTAAVRIRVR